MRLVYTFLLYTITPFVVFRWIFRSIKLPEYRYRLNERFGFYSESFQTECIWFHAVSVGEAEAVFPLVKAVGRDYPGLSILITTTTPTGSARVTSVFGDKVQHVYLPYDLPGNVARFIRTFKPRLGVIVETEIWPNLYLHCHQKNIPLSIINARMSENSLRGYLRIKSFIEKVLGSVKVVAAQSDADANRFLAAGIDQQSVRVTGNIKFDLQIDSDLGKTAKALRRKLFPNRPVWIAASTHEGEEDQILDAFARIVNTLPDTLLILVPRHPERFRRVADLCSSKGYSVATRTQGVAVKNSTEIFLLDTMGELRLFYAATDVAFVGGSLVPIGGHNLLEPAAVAKPIVFGPHMHNFNAIANLLEDKNTAIRVENSVGLAETVTNLLLDQAMAKKMGEAGKQVIEKNRGAMGRTLDLLRSFI